MVLITFSLLIRELIVASEPPDNITPVPFYCGPKLLIKSLFIGNSTLLYSFSNQNFSFNN